MSLKHDQNRMAITRISCGGKNCAVGFHLSWFSCPIFYGEEHLPLISQQKSTYPLVNVYITMENHHAISWVNPLFLWPFSITNC
jgi:hypothetical protein